MFIIISVVNLYTKFRGYFELSFAMAGVGNLYAQLGGYFKYFS
jgi:hypothetical protein